MQPFVHLHVHTEYSLLDGATRLNKLFSFCKDNNMPAIAITDHGAMYGVYKFFKMAKSEGIKPIIGCEFYMCENMYEKSGRPGDFDHLVLLAKDDEGYKNLVQLDSYAFVDGYYYKPRIDYKVLKKHTKGLVCLSACLSGKVQKKLLDNDYEGAKRLALELKGMFDDGDFYLEIQDHGIPEQRLINPLILKLGAETGIKVIATNDVHYLKKEDSLMHDVLLCIQTGKKIDDPQRMRFSGSEFYLKNYDEMLELFPNNPDVLTNAFEVMEKCNAEIIYHNLIPNYSPNDGSEPYEYLRKLTYDGLSRRYGEITDEIRQRAEYELGTINKLSFVEYFLIVWDFINYAKSIGISVGAGRGSGAGSIVAYSIGITDIDPIRFNLLFERFLNEDRVSMPDFDIDFCYERRGEVIDYVIKKYGKDKVSQIVTFGTMAAKGAIKDVARVFDIAYNEVDKVSKMLPAKGEIWQFLGLENPTNKKPKEDAPIIPDLVEIYKTNPQMKTVLDMAIKIQNMPRNTSMHAAGVVICKEVISDFVPLQRNGEDITTQFNMIEVEELGLLKMDFLGLRTLTDIAKALKYIKETTSNDIDFDKIGYNDKGVYDLISTGATDAVFQLEGSGMKGFMKNLKPDNLEEIIVGISLYRPGPMDSIPEYIQNKENHESITYEHPALKEVLDVTHKCIVYQEQVMQLVQKMAGFTLALADNVRRAMSKKKADEMQVYKELFINGGEFKITKKGEKDPKIITVPGCIANGINKEVAVKLFDQMEKFASYAFNKSHAACYAVLSYQTAYLKRYYPVQFITAILNNRIDKNDEVIKYISLLRSEGITILPPDINKSRAEFRVEGDCVRYGLGAIKNVGFNAVSCIVEEREKSGEFTSLKDFIMRVENNAINKRMVENMIKSGTFDSFSKTRSQQLAVFDSLIDRLQKDKKKQAGGQLSIFDMAVSEQQEFDAVEYPQIDEFDLKQKLAFEKDVLGVYVSGHPLQEYSAMFDDFSFNTKMINAKTDDDATDSDEEVIIDENTLKDNDFISAGGIITSFIKKLTKSGQEMAYAMLEDLYGEVEIVFFPKDYTNLKKNISEGKIPPLETGPIVKIDGRVQIRDGVTKILGNKVFEWKLSKDAPEVVIKTTTLDLKKRKLYINLDGENQSKLQAVKDILSCYSGETEVVVKLSNGVYKMPVKVQECVGLNSQLITVIDENCIKYK